MGPIRVGTGYVTRPRPRRLALFREGIRQRRLKRARRAHALRADGVSARWIPGSEHTHLMLPPKAY